MSYHRVIPNYDLYGDQASPEWSDSFNFEWIPQRSQPYNWVIQPHRHETFLQLLYLSSGQVDFLLDDTHWQAQAPCLMVVPCGHVHGFRFSHDVNGPVVTASQKTLESVAAVAMPELLNNARQAQALTYNPTPIVLAALMYLALLWPIVRLLSKLEHRATSVR